MATLVATRFNPRIRAFYIRLLAQGKPHGIRAARFRRTPSRLAGWLQQVTASCNALHSRGVNGKEKRQPVAKQPIK